MEPDTEAHGKWNLVVQLFVLSEGKTEVVQASLSCLLGMGFQVLGVGLYGFSVEKFRVGALVVVWFSAVRSWAKGFGFRF